MNINDALKRHVALETACVDRVLLNAYLANLQVSRQVMRFLCGHLYAGQMSSRRLQLLDLSRPAVERSAELMPGTPIYRWTWQTRRFVAVAVAVAVAVPIGAMQRVPAA